MKRQYYTVAILRTGEISWINTGVTIDLTAILTLIHFEKACCRQARFFVSKIEDASAENEAISSYFCLSFFLCSFYNFVDVQ